MFPQQPQQQFRTAGADVQFFYGPSSGTKFTQYSWIKPVGISHVYMMLIGAGGGGTNNTAGGASGNITVWYGAAQNVPNELIVSPGYGGAASAVGGNTTIQFKGTSTTTLLTASGGQAAGGGNGSDSATVFASSGFYQNVVGQTGAIAISPSSTTFLSGGGASTVTIQGNYGYGYASSSPNTHGYFMLQPIIVGVPVGASSSGYQAGVGCGGSYTNGVGGQGMVLIASW